MNIIAEYFIFLAKAMTVMAIITLIIGAVATTTRRHRREPEERLEIADLNSEYARMEEALSVALLTPPQLKALREAEKKHNKAKAKAEKRAVKVAKRAMKKADSGGGEVVAGKAGDGGDDSAVAKTGDGESTATNANAAKKTASDKSTTANAAAKTAGDESTANGDGAVEKTASDDSATAASDESDTTATTADTPATPPIDQPVAKRHKTIFVLDFDGDIRATAVASLRREVSALLTMARPPHDEVMLRLESAGGVVHGYGLAASQLERIRRRGIRLTVSVDKVAASGGYLMACVADRIIAAPFAVIGSIGVLVQLPNLHRLLKKHDVDFEQLTAGEHKRTLTVFGENTQPAREKMQHDLEETHALFKGYVKTQRPALDIDAVATGEHWLGSRALELGLVDHLQTSDDYLMAARTDTKLIRLAYTGKRKLLERLADKMQRLWL